MTPPILIDEIMISREMSRGYDFATKRRKRLSEVDSNLLILWWALQDSNLRLPPCESAHIRFFNDLQQRGDCLKTRKSCRTAGTVGWVVGQENQGRGRKLCSGRVARLSTIGKTFVILAENPPLHFEVVAL